jgi:hypothetical protein
MFAREVEEHSHMSVVEAVVHHPSSAPGLDDASRSKEAKRMGDVRLGRASGGREVADAEFARFKEGVEKSSARGIAKEAEELRKLLQLGIGKQLGFGSFDSRFVDDLRDAGVEPEDIIGRGVGL